MDGGVQEGLGDLLAGDAGIGSGTDAALEPGLASAQGGEDAERHEPAAAGVEARAVVDVAGCGGCDVVAEVGADVCEGVDDGLAPVPVDSGQHIPAVPATGEVLG